MPRRKKKHCSARRNLVLLALGLAAVCVLLALAVARRNASPFLPPEPEDVLARRRDAGNGYFTIYETMGALRVTPLPAEEDPVSVSSFLQPPDFGPPRGAARDAALEQRPATDSSGPEAAGSPDTEEEPGRIAALLGLEAQNDDPSVTAKLDELEKAFEDLTAALEEPRYLMPGHSATLHGMPTRIRDMMPAVEALVYRDLDLRDRPVAALTRVLDAMAVAAATTRDGGFEALVGAACWAEFCTALLPEVLKSIDDPEILVNARKTALSRLKPSRPTGHYVEFALRNYQRQRLGHVMQMDYPGKLLEGFHTRLIFDFATRNLDALRDVAEGPVNGLTSRVAERDWDLPFPESLADDAASALIARVVAGPCAGRDHLLTVRAGCATLFALEAYRIDHEQYPEWLDLLVPEYLDELPGVSFTYEPTGDGYTLTCREIHGGGDHFGGVGDRPGVENPGDRPVSHQFDRYRYWRQNTPIYTPLGSYAVR